MPMAALAARPEPARPGASSGSAFARRRASPRVPPDARRTPAGAVRYLSEAGRPAGPMPACPVRTRPRAWLPDRSPATRTQAARCAWIPPVRVQLIGESELQDGDGRRTSGRFDGEENAFREDFDGKRAARIRQLCDDVDGGRPRI